METQLGHEAGTVGELLRAVREERDLTQTDVARLLGASQSKVAKWEAGAHEMKFADAVAFADELRVPLALLVDALKREKASTLGGGGQSCALTGSNRGPADYGSAIERWTSTAHDQASSLSVPDFIPAWMLEAVSAR